MMDAVAVEDGTLSVMSRGEGPLVVFVHGTPSSAREFEGVMEALVEHRSLAVDHLGFGRSSKPAGADYSLPAHQRRFAASMALRKARAWHRSRQHTRMQGFGRLPPL